MTMKILLLLATGLLSATAWIATTPRVGQMISSTTHRGHREWQLKSMSSSDQPDFMSDCRFDFLFTEQSSSSTGEEASITQQSNSRRRIVLPSRDQDQTTTILASSTYAQTSTEAELSESSMTEESDDEIDPYASAFDSEMEKVQSYAERVEQASRSNSISDRLKKMDLQDIISTLIIPSIALFAAGRWVFNRASKRVNENTDAILESFTREMIYHDGDFNEMKLCYEDYSRRLLLLGPGRTDTMMKAYLESYAKKKTVSPQAIVSLSYAFTLAKLSEERAAKLLVSLCRRMGADKISSAGKLLFLGSRILKSEEGRKALEPIKDLIKGTYRDASVADSLVETSQQAIAEASYRAAVLAKGKKQKSLTVGWEALGLDRATAQRIFDEEAKEGFISEREAMYGGQTRKYDKKGRLLDKDGNLADPTEKKAKEAEKKEEEAVSNVYECSNCGFTLFVAQGRESKFYGSDFKCPECGAPKEKFEPKDDFGED